MFKEGKYDNYDYLNEETIRRACDGDSNALNKVIIRYQNYALKCFRTIAGTKYGLDVSRIPMEDLMQIVWIRLIKVIVRKYKVY